MIQFFQPALQSQISNSFRQETQTKLKPHGLYRSDTNLLKNYHQLF